MIRRFVHRFFGFAGWTFLFSLMVISWPGGPSDSTRPLFRKTETFLTSWANWPRPYRNPEIFALFVPEDLNNQTVADLAGVECFVMSKTEDTPRDVLRGLSLFHKPDTRLFDVLDLDRNVIPGITRGSLDDWDAPADNAEMNLWYLTWEDKPFGNWVLLDSLELDADAITKITLEELASGKYRDRLKGSIIYLRRASGPIVKEMSLEYATALAAIRDGRYLVPLPGEIYLAAWLLSITAFVLLLVGQTNPRACKAAYAIGVLLPIGSIIARATGHIPSFAYPIAYFWGGALLSGGARLAHAIRERRRLHKAFRQYVSRDVAEELIRREEAQILGGKPAVLTVLFLDIRGFTQWTNKAEPEEVVRTLNLFFGEMIEIVFRHNGTVAKLIGDALFAFFGEPIPCEHAKMAVEAAREMSKAAGRLLPEGLSIGVGVHTGPVVVGNFGTERFLDFTAIGRTVQIANQLQAAARGNVVLLSEATAREAGTDGVVQILKLPDGTEIGYHALES